MININYLAGRRPHYGPITFKYIKMIREDLKDKIHMTIITPNIPYWSSHAEDLRSNGITCTLVDTGRGEDYQAKIHYAVACDFEYSVKLDEDAFINNYVWDYMIENISVLDDHHNLVLTPLISTGIPTNDRFVEYFFDDKYKEELFNVYKNFDLPDVWGYRYSELNPLLRNWDSKTFYDAVCNIGTHYKGIHPMRMSKEAQMVMMRFCVANVDKFKEQGDYSLITLDAPYLCNNLFAIKTSTWRTLILDRSLYVDSFDEVPLNKFRERHDLKFLYIDKSFGIHTAYNTVDNGHGDIEQGFTNYSLG